MIQRGRKLIANLSGVVLPHTRKAPQPPKELTETAAKLWKDILLKACRLITSLLVTYHCCNLIARHSIEKIKSTKWLLNMA